MVYSAIHFINNCNNLVLQKFIISYFIDCFLAEKNRLREQINDLSVMLHALQEELVSQKAKSEDKITKIDDAVQENHKEIKTCNEKLSVVKENLENNFGKLEKDLKTYKERMERLRIDFEEDKRNIFQLFDLKVFKLYQFLIYYHLSTLACHPARIFFLKEGSTW